MSQVLPLLLLVYLAFMAYVGRQRFYNGEHFTYFGIIGIGLAIIVALYFVLKKKEQLKKRNQETNYGTYANEQDSQESSTSTTEKE